MASFDYEVSKDTLWTMSVDELRALPYIKLTNHEVLNAEELKRLRDLLFGTSRPVNGDQLKERLRNLSPRRSPRSPSNTGSVLSPTPLQSPTPTEEQEVERWLRVARAQYQGLLEMGGRPRRPINPNPPSKYPCKDFEYQKIQFYWGKPDLPSLVDHLFLEWERISLDRREWEDFRGYQKRKRKTPEAFASYRSFVQRFRRHHNLEGMIDVDLQYDATQQSKLDEWKEYHVYQSNRMNSKERAIQGLHRRRETLASFGEDGLRAIEWDEKRVPRAGSMRYAEMEWQFGKLYVEWIKEQYAVIGLELATLNGDRLCMGDSANGTPEHIHFKDACPSFSLGGTRSPALLQCAYKLAGRRSVSAPPFQRPQQLVLSSPMSTLPRDHLSKLQSLAMPSVDRTSLLRSVQKKRKRSLSSDYNDDLNQDPQLSNLPSALQLPPSDPLLSVDTSLSKRIKIQQHVGHLDPSTTTLIDKDERFDVTLTPIPFLANTATAIGPRRDCGLKRRAHSEELDCCPPTKKYQG